MRTVDRGTVTPSFLDNIPYRESKRELQDPEQLRDRQERIEGEQISQAVEEYAKIFKELVQFGRASGMKAVQRLLLQLYEPFAKALLNEINLVQTGTFGNDRSVALRSLTCIKNLLNFFFFCLFMKGIWAFSAADPAREVGGHHHRHGVHYNIFHFIAINLCKY